MKYIARVNKRVKYIRVYEIVKRVGPKQNFLSRLFTKALTKKEEK
ncbi:MAG: hypothetical protein QXT94_01330 [Methanothrix sp.]|jgi:hypothetical protein